MNAHAAPKFTHEGFSFPTSLGIWEQHIIRAREAVRISLAFDRQREQHAIYLNDDDLVWLRECAADARVEARAHIADAYAAGWKRSQRSAA